LVEKDIVEDWEKVKKVVSLVRERANFVNELWDQSSFFFAAPEKYCESAVKKRWKVDSPNHMLALMELLEKADDFSAANTEYIVKNWIEEKGWGMGAVMNAFRLCIVGESKGPHMFDITEIIGKEETIARLKKAIEELRANNE
jgi:glutamyl-tRNA synthetase